MGAWFSNTHFKIKDESSCNALHDLVSLVQIKKREKHPWKSFII